MLLTWERYLRTSLRLPQTFLSGISRGLGVHATTAPHKRIHVTFGRGSWLTIIDYLLDEGIAQQPLRRCVGPYLIHLNEKPAYISGVRRNPLRDDRYESRGADQRVASHRYLGNVNLFRPVAPGRPHDSRLTQSPHYERTHSRIRSARDASRRQPFSRVAS